MQDSQLIQLAIVELPLPLAQTLRRAVNAKSPQEQHNGAYYFVESALKLSASAQLGVYFSLGCPNSQLNQLVENLTRPSAGHWLALLRETAAYLAGRQDSGLLPLQGVYERLTRKLAMPAVKEFLEFAARSADKREGRQAFRVLDFFDAVVSYRNQELGHGAMRERAYYAEAAPLLLEAALEAVNALRPVGDMQFVVARDVVDARTQKASRRFDVLRGDGLHLPLETNHPKDPEILAGRLLLAAGNARVPLHPLLVYEIDKLDRDRVGFLNHVASQGRGDTQKLKRVEYLDYDSGDRLEGHDALSELAALLSRVRGQAVSIEAVAALSQGGTEIHVGAAPSDKGQFIGDFELVEELGRGGMGIVYKARQNSLRRVVALKVLPPALAGDPVSVARFKREIAALGRCDHPNVVKVLTAGQDGERHFYAMEYVEGSDLAQVCGVLSQWKTGSLKEGHILKAITDSRAQRSPGARTGEAPLPDVPKAAEVVPEISEGRDYFTRLAEIVGDAASGVQHLHEHGIIHRDLKPANIMLTQDGKRAVIMDLGLAQLQDRSLSLTASSVKILGTLRYMPPEQLQHQMLEVTPKADIYSLGATLYELAALGPMFDGDTEARLMQQVLQEEPKSPRSRNAAVPRDLETIITVAAAKAPNDRYATAGALASDLRAFSRGEPISARAPTTFHYLKLFYRKNSRLVQSMAVALVVLLALTAWFILSLDESRATAERSAEVARKREVEARSEAARANRAEQDARDKALAAQKARDEADTQRGVAEAKTREAEAALKEAARNLQQVHMEKGKAAAERDEAGVALNHYAEAARMAEELGDGARFKLAWEAYCEVEPRLPFELWRTEQNGFARVQENLVLSRDGAVMAGTCEQGATCVETATGRTLLSVNLESYVSFIELSSQGSHVIVSSWNRTQLWNVRTGHLIATLPLVNTEPKGASFSADDATLRVIDGKGELWEFECSTGKEISRRALSKLVYSASFSPDAGHVLVYGQDDYFDLFETGNWQSLAHRQVGIRYVRCMALAPGGNVALVCGDGGRIDAIEFKTGTQLGALPVKGGHGRSVVFATDGRAGVVSNTGDVALFERDWQAPRLLNVQAQRALSVNFLPGGNVLALGRSQAPPLLIDGRDGKLLLRDAGIGSTPLSVAMSPDRTLVAVGTFDGRIVLLDAATGRQVRALDKTRVIPTQLLFLPDARRIATLDRHAQRVCVLDVETGLVERSIAVAEGEERIAELACSPDGRFLYAATSGNRVVRCQVEGEEQSTGFVAYRGEMQGASIAHLRLSPDGNTVIVADVVGAVSWLAADDGAPLRFFNSRTERSELLAVNKEGTRAAYGIKPDRLFIRELESGKTVPLEFERSKPPIAAAFAANGELVTVDTDYCMRAYNAETGAARILLQRSTERPICWELDDSSRSIVVVTESGAARYAFESARHLTLPRIGQGDVFELLWVPGTSLLAVGGMGGPVSVVDVNSSRIVESFGGAALARAGFSVSPDGKTLICGGMANHVVAFDFAQRKARELYKIPEGRIVFCTDFSPDGSLVAMAQATEGDAENGSSVILLNTDTGVVVREVKTGKGMCVSARFISAGKQLLVGCIDSKPAIFDVATGDRVREFGEVSEQSLAFGINVGQTMCVCPGANYSLRLCGLPTGRELGTFAGHTSRVTRAVFSSDGTKLATIAADNTVRLWDVQTLREIARSECDHSTDITGLTFTPDGGALIFSNKASGLRLWDVDTRRALSSAREVKSAEMLTLARHLSCLRLDGFEIRPLPSHEVSASWATPDGGAPVPHAWPGDELNRAPTSPALQAWSAALRQWLTDWLVARPFQGWRQRYAAWRYIEATDENGASVRTGIAAGAPWQTGQRVDHTKCWWREQFGDEATLYQALGRAEEEGRWADALLEAHKLRENHPDDVWVLFRCGRAAMKVRSYSDAYRAFTALFAIRSDYLAAQALYGIVLTRQQYTDEALKLLDKVVAAGLGNAEIHMCRGLCLHIHDNKELAETEFRKAVSLDPKMFEAAVQLARFLAEIGKSKEAEQWYGKALELESTQAQIYSQRATLKRQRLDWDGAIEDLTQSIKLRLSNEDTSKNGSLAADYLNRGELLLLKRKIELAIEDFSKAISEDDWSILFRARVGRAQAHVRLQQWQQAFDDYTWCIEADKEIEQVEARVGRSLVALTLGDPFLAWKDLEAARIAEGLYVEGQLLAAKAAATFAAALSSNELRFPCHSEEARLVLEQKYSGTSKEKRDAEAAWFVSNAFERLNAAVAERFDDAELLEKAPEFEALRKDARWADLIKAVKANKR